MIGLARLGALRTRGTGRAGTRGGDGGEKWGGVEGYGWGCETVWGRAGVDGNGGDGAVSRERGAGVNWCVLGGAGGEGVNRGNGGGGGAGGCGGRRRA